MSCSQADNLIDAYLDGEMIGELKNALEQHAAQCEDCRGRIDRELDLRNALVALPVDDPEPGFFTQALANARSTNTDATQPSRVASGRWLHRLGGGLAAGFVLWFAAGFLLQTPGLAPEPTLPEVALSLTQPTPVNLVFSSTGDLHGARVSLHLPAGVRLVGYDERQTLSWTTNLKDGNNLLTLPLVARDLPDAHASGDGGGPTDEIVARLTHGDETKTFRLKVRINSNIQGTVL